MPDAKNKEVVSVEALRGTSDQDSQDSKSHNSQKQKQVASDGDGGNGVDGVGSSSSASSSQPSSTSHLDELSDSASSLQPDLPSNMGQGSSASNEETPATETSEDAALPGSNQQLPSRFSPVNSLGPSIRSGPENGQYAGSDPAAEDLMDCTTITAEASRNIVVAAKAKDLNTSLLTSDKMKKLEPMAELQPINGNFYPYDGPGILGVNINNGMLMASSWNGDMVDGSKQSICANPSFVLNLSPSGGINSFGDVHVSKADDVLMRLLYGEDVPQEL